MIAQAPSPMATQACSTLATPGVVAMMAKAETQHGTYRAGRKAQHEARIALGETLYQIRKALADGDWGQALAKMQIHVKTARRCIGDYCKNAGIAYTAARGRDQTEPTRQTLDGPVVAGKTPSVSKAPPGTPPWEMGRYEEAEHVDGPNGVVVRPDDSHDPDGDSWDDGAESDEAGQGETADGDGDEDDDTEARPAATPQASGEASPQGQAPGVRAVGVPAKAPQLTMESLYTQVARDISQVLDADLSEEAKRTFAADVAAARAKAVAHG